ncbi:SRPBCC family protein [Phaeobacter sp. C3_T13_0]|uniref:SRPBCC family protein n=1 Tax=Phaeobacter cretensis TaxID=3342641 RepID=UPI0039BD2A24
MNFSSTEDIDAPIAEVFQSISDFESLERTALRRGIDVQRMGDVEHPEKGLAWEIEFQFRAKKRTLHLTLGTYEPVTQIVLSGTGSGTDGALEIDLLALSPQRTRLSVTLSLEPKTLSGRLLVQSLKLAKTKLNRGFKKRVSEFAKQTEDRLSRTA